MSIHVQLEQFEGPMGLLLYLIKKEEMDISNIQIHKITSQYLDYIKVMRNFDLEVAGDFVAMAATLIHIKSRLLLPHYNDAGEVVEDAEDPRKELVNRLLEYQKYQEASKKLNELNVLGRDVFCRGQKETYEAGVEEIVLEDNALYQMISLYRVAFLKMKRRVHKVYAKGQSIASRIMEIKDRIVYGRQTELRALLHEGEHTRTKLLITFLSLLELTRLGFISIFQTDVYSEIYIDATKEIERDVVARVQEYETPDANTVASSWMKRAEQESITDDAEVSTVAANTVPAADFPSASSITFENAAETGVDLEALDALALNQVAPEVRSWEDEVVDQLAELSEDDFENLLNDPERLSVHDLAPALDMPFSEMSNELEVQLDARTAEIAAEEAASLTEYQFEEAGRAENPEHVSSFVYTGSVENVDAVSAEPAGSVDSADSASSRDAESPEPTSDLAHIENPTHSDVAT